MTETNLLQAMARGEDSRQQFKRDVTNADGMAAELATLANSGGGTLFLGVADDGSIAGLDAVDVRRLNLLISNAASQQVGRASKQTRTGVSNCRDQKYRLSAAGRAYASRDDGHVNGPV